MEVVLYIFIGVVVGIVGAYLLANHKLTERSLRSEGLATSLRHTTAELEASREMIGRIQAENKHLQAENTRLIADCQSQKNEIAMMKEQTAGQPGADRIHGYAANMLDDSCRLPSEPAFDAIWMSQFLDCFSEPQILSILRRAATVMTAGTRLYIMETFWDRQRFDTAALCLAQTSLYFTAIANGNSKMYHSDDLVRLVETAGLHVETIHDFLGLGHSVMVVKA